MTLNMHKCIRSILYMPATKGTRTLAKRERNINKKKNVNKIT